MFLNEVSSAHQDCINLIKYNNIVKYYSLDSLFIFRFLF